MAIVISGILGMSTCVNFDDIGVETIFIGFVGKIEVEVVSEAK